MPAYCFYSRIAPDRIGIYRERHAEVWPEMLEALRDAGWRNYSLFLSPDGLLVGYFESDDRDASQARMNATQVNGRWQAEMAALFDGSAGRPDEEFIYLPTVFNLVEQLGRHGLPVAEQLG